jgi:23S rRNA (uracil-5-)-methyltransferase RumA
MPLKITVSESARATPPCPHAAICGGCSLQEFLYTAQVAAKQEALANRLAEEHISAPLLPIIHSQRPEPLYYRNKIRYGFVQVGTQLMVSRHGKGEKSADVAVNSCMLQSDRSFQLAEITARILTQTGLTPYNPGTRVGDIYHLLVREGKHTGEVLVSLVVTAQATKHPEWVAAMKEAGCTSIWISTFRPGNEKSLTDTHQHGTEHIWEEINGIRYAISPSAFFQTNSELLHELYGAISSALPKKVTTVWDLYAGSATIASWVAPHAQQVVAIEQNSANCRDAALTIVANNRDNVEIYEGKVEDRITPALLKESRPDCIIVDPPRAGLSEKTRQLLVGIRPETLIYTSCNPETFFRDVAALRATYKIEHIQPLDMFPYTDHVELVAKLTLFKK